MTVENMDLILKILAASLACLIIAVLLYMKKGQLQGKKLHPNATLTEEEVYQRSMRILSDTRIKAVKIIDDANSQAQDIISKATISANASSEAFQQNLAKTATTQIKEFEKATAGFVSVYTQILEDLKSKNVEVFQSVSKNIETNASDEIKTFRDSMQKLAISSQTEIMKKINEDYQSLKTEMDKYKKIQWQKTTSEIYIILEKISKLVMGKALSLSEHEDLIIQALEKAKKEGSFQ
jgi:hypothetical protein